MNWQETRELINQQRNLDKKARITIDTKVRFAKTLGKEQWWNVEYDEGWVVDIISGSDEQVYTVQTVQSGQVYVKQADILEILEQPPKRR